MKPLLILLILVGLLSNSALASAPPSVQGRRIQELNLISTRVLQRSISRKFYKSLLISPIEGWIVVRATLARNKLGGARVMRSDFNGAYDQLALQFANDLEIAGYYGLQSRVGGTVLLHLLVYKSADGTMLLSFPTFDDPGGNQMYYWGCARLAVIKKDGRWVEIEGPESLHGMGWAVRPANSSECPFHCPDGGPTGAREKKYLPTLPTPSAAVLRPIIASAKADVIVGQPVGVR